MEYTVQGFKGSAVAAGLKKNSERNVALIFCEREAVAAGVFTTNRVKAAPVILSQENIRSGKARAIIVNAGNANACTGATGLGNAKQTAAQVAQELNISPDEVLVASTGVIGSPLNMDLILPTIPELVKGLLPGGLGRVAEAILTTDSFPKLSLFEGVVAGKPYRILGMAKGAGMIMPQMATMLCFILTDVAIDADQLSEALSVSAERTFNRISVDGDTSTNDTVFVLASGMVENGPISADDYRVFSNGLSSVMDELGTMIVKDGEGATKVVKINVKGASTPDDAITAARTIANSSLVKTAFYGQDPNWGRIMAALGRSNIHMKEDAVNIWVNDILIVSEGLGKGASSEMEAAEKMKEKTFGVTVDLQQGEYEDRVTTCDLTHEYVTINAGYRT